MATTWLLLLWQEVRERYHSEFEKESLESHTEVHRHTHTTTTVHVEGKSISLHDLQLLRKQLHARELHIQALQDQLQQQRDQYHVRLVHSAVAPSNPETKDHCLFTSSSHGRCSQLYSGARLQSIPMLVQSCDVNPLTWCHSGVSNGTLGFIVFLGPVDCAWFGDFGLYIPMSRLVSFSVCRRCICSCRLCCVYVSLFSLFITHYIYIKITLQRFMCTGFVSKWYKF